MSTNQHNLLTDKNGRPLPLRMSQETWDDMKAKYGINKTSPIDFLVGVEVVIQPHLAKGTILQYAEPSGSAAIFDVCRDGASIYTAYGTP